MEFINVVCIAALMTITVIEQLPRPHHVAGVAVQTQQAVI